MPICQVILPRLFSLVRCCFALAVELSTLIDSISSHISMSIVSLFDIHKGLTCLFPRVTGHCQLTRKYINRSRQRNPFTVDYPCVKAFYLLVRRTGDVDQSTMYCSNDDGVAAMGL
ncbi:Uncharacterised protein [BD1-7 clade bacterium]|uniref:Uncharacterized protein n=1 Tax=BD1-7 clade bacterium TaxID=2029982 RepID=A0A5S9QTT8_9GAMM|nr:Uncharacterised protein [BD1-7 clade bacterium]CAA0122227.1 Uncharacterised protein [BD1-7 clade bacterium]